MNVQVEFSLQFMLDECDGNINELSSDDRTIVIGAIQEIKSSERHTYWCDAFGLDTETHEIIKGKDL